MKEAIWMSSGTFGSASIAQALPAPSGLDRRDRRDRRARGQEWLYPKLGTLHKDEKCFGEHDMQ